MRKRVTYGSTESAWARTTMAPSGKAASVKSSDVARTSKWSGVGRPEFT